MAYTSAFLLFVVLVGSAGAEGEESCGNQRVMKCVRQRVRPDGPFPDEKFLRENCGPLQNQIRCFVEHNETCIEPLDETTSFAGFAAAENLVTEFCDEDSELHRKYIENIECLNNHEKEIIRIVHETEQSIYDFARRSELLERFSEDNDLPRVLHCLTFEILSLEVGNVLRSNCGEDAADIFFAIRDRLTNYLTSNCEQHRERIHHYNRLYNEAKSEDLFKSISNILE